MKREEEKVRGRNMRHGRERKGGWEKRKDRENNCDEIERQYDNEKLRQMINCQPSERREGVQKMREKEGWGE